MQPQDVLLCHKSTQLLWLLQNRAVGILAHQPFLVQALFCDYLADGPPRRDPCIAELLRALLSKNLLEEGCVAYERRFFARLDHQPLSFFRPPPGFHRLASSHSELLRLRGQRLISALRDDVVDAASDGDVEAFLLLEELSLSPSVYLHRQPLQLLRGALSERQHRASARLVDDLEEGYQVELDSNHRAPRQVGERILDAEHD